MSLICISWETVEKLEWAALLWILVLAKARSAVPISAAISAKPSNAGQRQNQRNPEWREAEGQLAASLAPCHLPFCLYARPIPFFQKSPKLPLQLIWMQAGLVSRLNRPAQIAAVLVVKILGTPE